MANAKMPRLLAFARHVEMVIIETLKPRSTTLMRCWTLFIMMGTLEYSEEEPALQCRKQDCAPDSSSLKPGSGATEGVLDKGVSGQPDYIHHPDYCSVKIQDSRLCPVSGWDSPLRGTQAWRFRYVDSFLCKPTQYNPSPLKCLYKPERLVLRRPITITIIIIIG